MADGAALCLGLSSRHRSGRHIGDEPGGVVSQLRSLEVFRRLDDTHANRLGAAAFDDLVNPAREPGARYLVCFDHPNPLPEWHRREVLGGHPCFGVGGGQPDPLHERRRSHARLARLAQAIPPVGHLLHDVLVGLPGHAGVFRFALAVGQVAVAAGHHAVAAAGSDDRGHRRMAVGVPVGRTVVDVDLRPGNPERRVEHRHDFVRVWCRGIVRQRVVEYVRPRHDVVRAVRGLSLGAGHAGDSQQCGR